MKLHWLMGAGVVGFLGCAVAPVQVEQERSATSAALTTAQGAGADSSTEAASRLRQAQDERAQADKAAKNGDDPRALGLYQRAQADADLATALARESNMQGEATAAEQKLQQAQSQTQVNGNP